MGIASKSDSIPSPLSPEGHAYTYPESSSHESSSHIGAGTLPDLARNLLNGNIHNIQPQNGDQDAAGSSRSQFAIPTKNESLSSGFPFHPRLYSLNITHDQWSLFSSDIVNASKLSATEDFLAWTTGITTGTLTSPFLLIFSPWVGYISGRAVHRKTIQKTVKEKLQREGDLRSIIRRWNEDIFMPKGFQAWLELPIDPGELGMEYQADETFENKGSKDLKKAEKEAAKRFRIIIITDDDAIAQSGSSVLRPATTVLAEASTETEAYELDGTPSEPPPYEEGFKFRKPARKYSS